MAAVDLGIHVPKVRPKHFIKIIFTLGAAAVAARLIDPKIVWYHLEQLGCAQNLWLQIWEMSQELDLKQPTDSAINPTDSTMTMTTTTTTANSPIDFGSLPNAKDHSLLEKEPRLLHNIGMEPKEQAQRALNANENQQQQQQSVSNSCYNPSKEENVNNASTTCDINYNYEALVGVFGGCPWRRLNKRYSKGVIGLNEEIEDFLTYMRPSAEEYHIRLRVFKRIEQVIHDLWPGSKVEIFGSFRTGLYLPTSDIDLVVTDVWSNLPLHTLERALIDQNIVDPSSIKVLNRSPVPVVRLTDKKTKINLDINFIAKIGIKKSEMIKTFKRQYPVLEKLFMILKQFLLLGDFNRVFAGGISSYGLSLMIISFLQSCPRADVNDPNVNAGVLLIEFLELYGRKFNYASTCIRVKNVGAHTSREEAERKIIDEHRTSLLCIEDPLLPNVDLGRRSRLALNMKESFDWAYRVLSEAIDPFNFILDDADNISLLGRIIRVDDEVIEYRKWIKKTFPAPSETDSGWTGSDVSRISDPVRESIPGIGMQQR